MALVWTKTAVPAVQDGEGPFTFSSVAIGDAASDRIVVVIPCQGSRVTAVTINSSSATRAVESNASWGQASIWYLAVTTGTTATIVVTSGYSEHGGIIVGTLTGSGATPSSTALLANANRSDPHVCGAITVPTGGIALGSFVGSGGVPPVTPTWNSGTKDDTIYSVAGQWVMTSGYDGTAGSRSFSVSNFNSWDGAWAAAAWEPAAATGPSPGSIVPTITL